MRRMMPLVVVALWAFGCPTSIAPFPDIPGLDPGGQDSVTFPDPSPPDPGRPDTSSEPGPGDLPPTDLGGEEPGGPDAPQDPGTSDQPPPSDPGEDPGQPPVDPCGIELNPQCTPAQCPLSTGGVGTCMTRPDGSCQCTGDAPPVQCSQDQDCVNRPWLVNCLGHWDCLLGTCREACGAPCGDQTCDPAAGESPLSCGTDCPAQAPCQQNGDCLQDSWCAREPGACDGSGICQARPTLCPRIYQPVCGCDGNQYSNSCQAAAAGVGVRSSGLCPTQECQGVADCLGRPWLVDCMGRWECRQGTCTAVCDFQTCGDDRCEPERGEDVGSCPVDCRADLCALQAGPFCMPWECVRSDGTSGRCGTRDDGACLCGPLYGTCSQDRDCTGQAWPIKCLGHWDCNRGACEPACGEPCGNNVCEPAQGEDRNTCFSDCPDRDTHCDDGSEPLCEMLPPKCGVGEILAYQNACYACVNPATCRPWGEPGCARDADCPPDQWCSPCGTSSCPDCDNCLPACVPHLCPTEMTPVCLMFRPDCGREAVAVVRNGCWVCVDRATCEPVPVTP